MPREPRRRSGGADPASTAPAASLPRPRAHENLPRPAAAPVAAGVGPAIRRRRNPLRFLGRFEPRFIADIISELRKVTWPTFTETRYLTMVVAIVAISVGIVLGGVDFLFGWMIERIFFN